MGSGCTNAQETYTYNNRLQPVMVELVTGNGNTCLVYNYYADVGNPSSCALPSQGTLNNGNVMGYWYQDNVQPWTHTATYTYDALNRLTTAWATGNATYNLTFGYDRYGNMTCVTNGQTNGPCPNLTFSLGTNRLTTSGFTYDAAGNLTNDCSTMPAHTYQWDAEGRVSYVDPANNPPTWSFTYNAVGDRVQWVHPGGTDQHIFDPAGNSLGVYGAWDVIWLGSRVLAVYEGSETNFFHVNHLNSASVLTNHAGTAVEDILFYPWGQDTWHLWGSGGYNFAGMPYYDTNTNTNPTMFRFYSQNLGRWHSPDPMGGDITNPQSLNRYAYVLNNPTSLTDPLGLCGEHYTTVEWDSEGNVIDWWEDEGDPCLPEEQSQSNHDPYGLAYLPLGSGWGWGAGGGAGSGGANIIYWSQLQPLVHQNNHSGECDELIDCIVRIESSAPGGYDANALGTPFTPRGGGPQQQARGLMQVTQGAASTVVNAYGIATSGDALYKLLFNPSINISAGSYYLQYLKGRTGGDLLKALNRYGGSSSGGYADAIHDCVEQLKQGNLGRAEGAAHGHQ